MKKISPKIAVISGGRGYLGSAISEALINHGFKIVIVDRKTKIEELSRQIKKQYGLVSVIIHAASERLIRQPVLAGNMRDFESQFEANVLRAFTLFKYFCPLLAQNGTIIGITTKVIEPKSAHVASGSYIPAKYALRGLLRVLAHELTSIRVYALSPAFMAGGLNSDIPNQAMEFIKNKSDPRDLASPEQAARSVLKLIGDVSGRFRGRSISIPDNKSTKL